MNTEIKESPKILKDKIANILFTDSELHEYVEKIIAAALHIDYKYLKENLSLQTIRVNANTNIRYGYADAVYESDDIIINLETNMTKSKESKNKNMGYVCNLILKQMKPNKKVSHLKGVYQININNYDEFNEGKFIYESVLMEKDIHKMRDENLKILDINVASLRDLLYTEVKEKDSDSLEKLLYIFVCDNKSKLEELYVGDEVMKKVNEKVSALTEDFAEGLYYNPDELLEASINSIGYDMGEENKAKEIAKRMLEENSNIDFIIRVTGLTLEEINSLKENDEK